MENLIKKLEPDFTKPDIEGLKLYYELSIKYEDHINEKFVSEMSDHPIFGPLLKLQTEEERKAQNKISQQLLYNAIYNNEWHPYLRHLIMQGITYANMGMDFSAWYEVVSIVKDYYLPCIVKEHVSSTEKMISTIHGLGKLTDFAMQAIAESFLLEKNKLIKQQQERQAELIKELESFAYIVSHDLKSPLRGIAKISEWLALDYNDVIDAKGKEQLRLMQSRVQRLDNLIDGILSYSRLGRSNEKREPVNISEVLNDVSGMLLPPHNVTIKKPEKFPVVNYPRTKLVQVFSNLISNAIKYNNKEQCVITISVEEEPGLYKFTISDNGPGIEQEYHEKIFEIFQTLNSKDEKESTGIGLAIVKKAVESERGKISIESEPGKGATFIFTIPKN